MPRTRPLSIPVDFPSTVDTLLERTRNATFAEDEDAWNRLVQRYREPTIAALRGGFSFSIEDAEDVAQEVFLALHEKRKLHRFDPARGRFRLWLKALIFTEAAHKCRAARTVKRGGRMMRTEFDRIDDHAAHVAFDAAFEDSWRNDLIARALERTREQLKAAGKEAYFDVLLARDSVLPDGDRGYRALAERFGLTPEKVRDRLAFAREILRESVRLLIWKECSSIEDFEEAWNAVLGR